jgi:hypothetical protein
MEPSQPQLQTLCPVCFEIIFELDMISVTVFFVMVSQGQTMSRKTNQYGRHRNGTEWTTNIKDGSKWRTSYSQISPDVCFSQSFFHPSTNIINCHSHFNPSNRPFCYLATLTSTFSAGLETIM